MKVKSESEVTQSCPTPSDPMDCSPPGSSTHGILQARVLEWGAVAFSDTCVLGSSETKASFGSHSKTAEITIWLAYSYICTKTISDFSSNESLRRAMFLENMKCSPRMFVSMKTVLLILTSAQGKKLPSAAQTPEVLFTVNPPLPHSHVFTWLGVRAALPGWFTALTQALMRLCSTQFYGLLCHHDDISRDGKQS